MHIRDRPCVSMAHRNRLPVSRTKNIPEEVKVAQGQTVFTITTMPDNTIGHDTFRQITDTAGDPRILQFSLKVEF
jgi:hypothetical protein